MVTGSTDVVLRPRYFELLSLVGFRDHGVRTLVPLVHEGSQSLPVLVLSLGFLLELRLEVFVLKVLVVELARLRDIFGQALQTCGQ